MPTAPGALLESAWTPLLWLVASLAMLAVLSRWLSRHVQGVLLLLLGSPEAVMYLHYALLLPGLLLHELSHWTAAQLLLVETKGISLLPRKGRGNKIMYGSVRIVPAGPLRNSLIGLAPLITGSIAVLLCAAYGLGVELLVRPTSWTELVAYLQAPNALIWIYIIFAISNSMLPSESDRESWLPVGAFLALLIIVLIATNLAQHVPASIADAFAKGASLLAYAFTLTIIVDLLGVIPLMAMELILSRIRGRRVQY
jgi:hypothetical protein